MIKERVENGTTVVLNATPLQHVSMTRKNRLIGLAFLCVTIPLMLVAQPAEKKTLVGVWEVKISAGGVPPPPLLSIASFGGDGSFTTAGNTKFPQGLGLDERGPGYGRWAQTGDREFKLTFYAVLLKDGEVNGYLQVHGTLILSESGNEFTTRDCKVDFMDADRKVLDSDNDRVKGTKLETP
ncbi:MAG TPA: hypothetical protein VFO40_26295 [Chthoniobacterales bacterium]|nr:hypothetical protein [Chthoniobacterales bacterium]